MLHRESEHVRVGQHRALGNTLHGARLAHAVAPVFAQSSAAPLSRKNLEARSPPTRRQRERKRERERKRGKEREEERYTLSSPGTQSAVSKDAYRDRERERERSRNDTKERRGRNLVYKNRAEAAVAENAVHGDLAKGRVQSVGLLDDGLVDGRDQVREPDRVRSSINFFMSSGVAAYVRFENQACVDRSRTDTLIPLPSPKRRWWKTLRRALAQRSTSAFRLVADRPMLGHGSLRPTFQDNVKLLS